MTNPDNVGGLPELPRGILWRTDAQGWQSIDYSLFPSIGPVRYAYSEDQMRAYGEQWREYGFKCGVVEGRAAPAGGDWRTASYAATDDAIRKDSGMTLHDRVEYALREAGFDHGEASRIASMSAPAGSGEVEDLAKWHDSQAKAASWSVPTSQAIPSEVRFHERAAALLRKISPVGSGEACDNCGKPLRADHAPITACACARLVLTSAYAGQGGVEAVAQKLLVGASELELRFGGASQSPVMRAAAALLRKLQQGADGRKAGFMCIDTDRIALVDRHDWPPTHGFRNVWVTPASQDQEGGK